MDAWNFEDIYQQAIRNSGTNGEKPVWFKGIKIPALNMNFAPLIVDNLWRQQEVLLLGGHSKSWKSWAQMDLMYCISNGFGWLSWPNIVQGPVLHIDLELFDFEIRRRFEAIHDSYTGGTLENIEVICLRGIDFTIDHFLHMADWIEPQKYSAISFDPTYRMLAGSNLSESDPSVITKLMNCALQVAKKLGCGIDLLQHFFDPPADFLALLAQRDYFSPQQLQIFLALLELFTQAIGIAFGGSLGLTR